MKKKNKKSGFTLIEIIIVVVIIGILAAAIGPNLFNKVSQAEVVGTKNQIKSLGVALDSYRLDNKSYPSTEQGLRALIEQPKDSSSKNWNGPYLEKNEIPLDSWGNEFKYKYPGVNNSKKYDLWSKGADGVDNGNGGDDITNW